MNTWSEPAWGPLEEQIHSQILSKTQKLILLNQLSFSVVSLHWEAYPTFDNVSENCTFFHFFYSCKNSYNKISSIHAKIVTTKTFSWQKEVVPCKKVLEKSDCFHRHCDKLHNNLSGKKNHQRIGYNINTSKFFNFKLPLLSKK